MKSELKKFINSQINGKTPEEVKNFMIRLIDQVEHELVDHCLQYNLEVSLGDYGTGRSLILEDDHWSGKSRGEWLSSSETC